MKIKFKQRMKRQEFEAKLMDMFGHDNLSARPFVEDGQRLTLYYTDRHIATWTKGEGWIFDTQSV